LRRVSICKSSVDAIREKLGPWLGRRAFHPHASACSKLYNPSLIARRECILLPIVRKYHEPALLHIPHSPVSAAAITISSLPPHHSAPALVSLVLQELSKQWSSIRHRPRCSRTSVRRAQRFNGGFRSKFHAPATHARKPEQIWGKLC